mmetsp:Transcript_94220/g.281171  ORF Transcript_94220/g.281171 Transcript_94220/m.281171 type:complete len:284 (-) Transcript_94220:67-918(-)
MDLLPDLLPDVRIPLTWQAVKEHAWRHPCVLAAVLTTAGSTYVSTNCGLALLTGNAVSGVFFRWLIICTGALSQSAGLEFSTWPSLGRALAGEAAGGNSTAGQIAGVGLPDEARLVRHPWQLCAMGILSSAVPTCTVGTAYILQVLGEMGRLRLDQARRYVLGALVWSACSLWLFVGLCRQWEVGVCQRLDAQQDVVCQDGARLRMGPLFGQLSGFMCNLETTTECEMLILAIYAYTCLAMISLVGTLMALIGFDRARQELDAKWALHRAGKHTTDERSGLLA